MDYLRLCRSLHVHSSSVSGNDINTLSRITHSGAVHHVSLTTTKNRLSTTDIAVTMIPTAEQNKTAAEEDVGVCGLESLPPEQDRRGSNIEGGQSGESWRAPRSPAHVYVSQYEVADHFTSSCIWP